MTGRFFRGFASAILVGALLVAGCGGGKPERDARVHVDGDTASVALTHVDDRKGGYFWHLAAENRRVDFLLFRDSSGNYHATLDACLDCYRWRKGYLIMGDGTIVCRKCGEKYNVDSLKRGRGACVPIPLTLSREGDTVFIPVSELEAGARYF